MKRIFLLALMAATLFTSCKKDKDEEKGGIFKGPVASIHHGKAWT